MDKQSFYLKLNIRLFKTTIFTILGSTNSKKKKL